MLDEKMYHDMSLYNILSLICCYNERMIIIDVPIVCVMSLSLFRRTTSSFVLILHVRLIKTNTINTKSFGFDACLIIFVSITKDEIYPNSMFSLSHWWCITYVINTALMVTVNYILNQYKLVCFSPVSTEEFFWNFSVVFEFIKDT